MLFPKKPAILIAFMEKYRQIGVLIMKNTSVNSLL